MNFLGGGGQAAEQHRSNNNFVDESGAESMAIFSSNTTAAAMGSQRIHNLRTSQSRRGMINDDLADQAAWQGAS